MVSTVTISTITNATEFTHYSLVNATSEICAALFEDKIPSISGLYCNFTFDGFLCWPPTLANATVQQQCPQCNGLDVTSWTNYTPCYTDEMRVLMKAVFEQGKEMAEKKFFIAESTRTLEIFGLSVSLFTLLISLIIFCNIRSLRNARTKIHKNLFVAMVIQVLVRLTVYLDQIRNGRNLPNENLSGIQNTPYLCESSYIFLEYARTAMFMWMFIEGLYLHNVVTVTVFAFQGQFPHTFYAILGWGLPAMMTAVWATFTAKYKKGLKCWWGYNLTSIYWILEGPRLAVLLLNFIFLLNIIRVLVVKLRQSHTSDIEQVRKAVRAAIVLIPLLGITNLLNMTDAPLHRTAWEFGLWSYTTHFLTSFQGLFIATIYCFLNNEVRAALMKSLGVYMSLRGNFEWIPRRHSMFSGNYGTAADTEQQCNENQNRNRHQRQKQNNWITLCFNEKKMVKDKDKDIPRPSPE
ncbi:PDF receptor isoform X2 [Contarinia nasturtii]|nr:PDF receptor isoform X2 [Contarinia nasturtii]